MPRIAFWNVQRLGAGTDRLRRAGIRTLAAQWNPDLFLTCELTRACTFPIPQNLTYRRANVRQLCYGALDADEESVELRRDEPDLTDDYRACAFKGGTDFTRLASRALGFAEPVVRLGNVDVYVIHAPASMGSARKVMAYIASGIRHRYQAGGNWIVVGDFNLRPGILRAVNIPNIANLIKSSGQSTHYYRRRGTYSELDYALSNIAGLRVRALRHTRWRGLSDHGPILLTF
jgi:hypothetical protein